jgi:hypothetical protein
MSARKIAGQGHTGSSSIGKEVGEAHFEGCEELSRKREKGRVFVELGEMREGNWVVWSMSKVGFMRFFT